MRLKYMHNQYNPKNIEEKIYLFWEKNQCFTFKKDTQSKNFCIIMPPPNITGNLHMGHAFQQTIMDILIRYYRMQGYNTLWQMGVDHAGIATQMLISKTIQKKYNCSLKNFGRVQFIKKCFEWKCQNDKNIYNQIKRLGSSVDWTRPRFTLDDISVKGVKKVFIDLYENNFIYRRKKLSYWDTTLKTVLSDLEIKHRTIKGKMWNIKYFVVDALGEIDQSKYLVISTTRPETLLGDTAISVHPKDERYTKFIGLYVIVPIVNRVIPIISDNFVDIKKGTGCVKITPAHDFNDYNIALRNKIPMINIFTKDCKICDIFEVYDILGNHINIYNTDVPKDFKGLTRLQARKKILIILSKNKLLVSTIETNVTSLYGDRSGSEVECILTDQWYLRTKKLSKEAIKVVEENKILFYPKQYKNLYLSWMHNIQDWCISRQLWWGHRIPAWYDILGNVYVGNNEDEIRKKYTIPSNVNVIQETDVLDTWFSSSLWSFLALDWPKKNNLLKIFHPTDILVSGFDIIFFWVARMIMMTLYCIKDNLGIPQIPFKNVYITGLIKDELGQKMSKSKGNVLDPLDVIDGISLENLLKKRISIDLKSAHSNKIFIHTKKMFPKGIQSFGADTLRTTFASFSSITRDIHLNIKQLCGYRNFCNKIWNASRFILLNISLKDILCNHKNDYYFFNTWISLELNNTIKIYRNALDSYRFDIATNILYDFFWNKFCNWYLEITKIVLKIGCLEAIQSAKYTLVHIFEIFLRTAHPILPFITEYIWQKIKRFLNITSTSIMLQNFPNFNTELNTNNVISIMEWFQKIILFLRKTRANLNIPCNFLLCLYIVEFDSEYKKMVFLHYNIIKAIGFLKKIIFVNINTNIPDNAIIEIINNHKIFFVPDITLSYTIQSNEKMHTIHKLNKKIKNLEKILSNKNFLEHAPKKLIDNKTEQLKNLIMEYNKLL